MWPLSIFLVDSLHLGTSPMSAHFSANLQSDCFSCSPLICAIKSFSSCLSAVISESSFTIFIFAWIRAQQTNDKTPRTVKIRENLGLSRSLSFLLLEIYLKYFYSPQWLFLQFLSARPQSENCSFACERLWKVCGKLHNSIKLLPSSISFSLLAQVVVIRIRQSIQSNKSLQIDLKFPVESYFRLACWFTHSCCAPHRCSLLIR